jgi:FAD/FMN-containing dehydrogenase
MILRGQGRSYGDAAILTDGLVALSEKANRVISFDEEKGLLEVEAGRTLAQIMSAVVPLGWFPAVAPGTKFVSVGGCVAADIHGKNHHRDGAFGRTVQQLRLVLANGDEKLCSSTLNRELFQATLGGMGLTAIIAAASLQLLRIDNPYIVAQQHRARDLDELLTLLQAPEFDDHYTVAWLDCLARGASLGRGILMRGHHARNEELPRSLNREKMTPAGQFNLNRDLPSWFLNRLTLRAFNELYYRWQGRAQRRFVCHYESFLFPLDRIGDWNRLYGRRGFVQYQCVFPLSQSRAGVQAVLEESTRSRRASFLGVLKRFGAEGEGFLSFPRPGYTLTLDFPINDPQLFAFLDRLDEVVLQHEGRVYLAKDARLGAAGFRRMYPRLDEWLRIKTQVDPENRFDSDLARRLELRSFAVG